MLYKHENKGYGIITIYDGKGEGHVLRPGEKVIIDKNSEGYGVEMVEEIEEKVEQKEEVPKKEYKKEYKKSFKED